MAIVCIRMLPKVPMVIVCVYYVVSIGLYVQFCDHKHTT